MSKAQTIFGPILAPRVDGTVDFYPDGAMRCDTEGIIDFVGDRSQLQTSGFPRAAMTGEGGASLRAGALPAPSRTARGIICPPFLDAHIHIPQHPIRGHFMDGVTENPPEGRLLAGLNRNVFPAESRCADDAVATQIVDEFSRETLAQGVVGGAAYMTVHAGATDIALARLHDFWSVGLVLMEMNCPEYLRTDRSTVTEPLVRDLAKRFGRRFIMTDRFAVAVNSELRQWASRMAGEFGLRTQTHLNEQLREKEFVEKTLYKKYASYTDVYYADGLLDHDAILAHCIHMADAEFATVARSESFIAHCPTSNTLLCSGVMPLDRVLAHGLEYAICTDVGASPTTSMLAEMAQFLKVHAGRSDRATPAQALYRATRAPAKMLGLSEDIGALEIGKPMSFIEVAADGTFRDADDAIRRGLLDSPKPSSDLEQAFAHLGDCRLDIGPQLSLLESDCRETAVRMERKVQLVTLAGEEIWRRSDAKPV